MEENLAIFDFELTDDEVKKLSDISQSMTGSSALQRNQHTHFFVEAAWEKTHETFVDAWVFG